MIKLFNIKTSYSLGKSSESRAAKYLKKCGWQVIAMNYKTKFGEIDILAEKDNTLVAFEVKYRENEEALPYVISDKQQKRIQNALLFFQQNNSKYNDYYMRFDAVLLSKSSINHIENAWEEI
ncbi:MAG: YraN family protein [Alphaproteobacteria bacterium]|nr:YraN family protein [Alphaproteobacteria bacterium]